jgi:hypothetical protein
LNSQAPLMQCTQLGWSAETAANKEHKQSHWEDFERKRPRLPAKKRIPMRHTNNRARRAAIAEGARRVIANAEAKPR